MSSEYPWRDPETLRELYWDERLSSYEIADKLGCAAKTVRKWMGKHGIETRSQREVTIRRNRSGPTQYRTSTFGHEMWQTEVDGSTHTVMVHRLLAALEFGLESINGNHVHHINGVPWDNRVENLKIMDPSEHHSLHRSAFSRLDKLLIREMYKVEGTSTADIAPLFDVCKSTVSKSLRRGFQDWIDTGP